MKLHLERQQFTLAIMDTSSKEDHSKSTVRQMKHGPELHQIASVSEFDLKYRIKYSTSSLLSGIDCGFLPAPKNGDVKFVEDTRLGSYAQFSCDKGFKLVGADSRLCQANGDWSLSQPTCESRIHSTSMEGALFYLSLSFRD